MTVYDVVGGWVRGLCKKPAWCQKFPPVEPPGTKLNSVQKYWLCNCWVCRTCSAGPVPAWWLVCFFCFHAFLNYTIHMHSRVSVKFCLLFWFVCHQRCCWYQASSSTIPLSSYYYNDHIVHAGSRGYYRHTHASSWWVCSVVMPTMMLTSYVTMNDRNSSALTYIESG